MFKYNVERTAGYTKHILFVENKSTDYLAKSNVFEGSTFLLGYIIIRIDMEITFFVIPTRGDHLSGI